MENLSNVISQLDGYTTLLAITYLIIMLAIFTSRSGLTRMINAVIVTAAVIYLYLNLELLLKVNTITTQI